MKLFKTNHPEHEVHPLKTDLNDIKNYFYREKVSNSVGNTRKQTNALNFFFNIYSSKSLCMRMFW